MIPRRRRRGLRRCGSAASGRQLSLGSGGRIAAIRRRCWPFVEPIVGRPCPGWSDSRRPRSRAVADKHNDADHILAAAGNAFIVALSIEGKQLSSQELSDWLDKQAHGGRELAFIIGGPDGLPKQVVDRADLQLSLGRQTMPHDLAMISLLETLYRSSTIGAGHPYHR